MNKLSKSTLLPALVVSLSACISNMIPESILSRTTSENKESDVTTSTQHTPKHLQFVDTSTFDKQLSRAMLNKHYEIEISMLTPFSTNNVPKKLDTWLTVIGDSGGEVKVEPVEEENAEKTRNFIVPIVLGLVSMYKEYRDQEKYEPAKNYNATVFYKKNEQGEAIVDKIVFFHREKSVNIDSQ